MQQNLQIFVTLCLPSFCFWTFDLQNEADEFFTELQDEQNRLAQSRDKYEATVRYIYYELEAANRICAVPASIADVRTLYKIDQK